MFPLGVLSQKKEGVMVFININGTYFENTVPSSPSWSRIFKCNMCREILI